MTALSPCWLTALYNPVSVQRVFHIQLHRTGGFSEGTWRNWTNFGIFWGGRCCDHKGWPWKKIWEVRSGRRQIQLKSRRKWEGEAIWIFGSGVIFLLNVPGVHSTVLGVHSTLDRGGYLLLPYGQFIVTVMIMIVYSTYSSFQVEGAQSTCMFANYI